MKNIELSVLIMTYNHENLIKQAIDSALMQLTSFNFEIVIGEDLSSDKTRDICCNYENLNPERIRVLETPRNFGMVGNFLRTLKECRGKYISLLEGDDYWLSPKKL
jgi:glycosyltransferase involved in cell wall biosynthesis